ncbi:cellulose synthase E6 [Olea europaea subsp. europaea]|uniref:Cellulose synthase E6 n=1 Tax=Olea europaea subsp. europaea TaxID=158383 RepID=A0A8S0SS19_OLEEU|nr:cellulose synthase E6 [Olea europaea subsp. europaea]
MTANGYLPLFETKPAKGRNALKLFSLTILLSIFLIWLYRLMYIPRKGEAGRYAWIGMFISEVFFGLYWIMTQTVRWNVVHRYPFKDRLSSRYEDGLPGVDIFVCTADPILEPPSMVMNTVLSVMAYNYPPEKLSVYLSDDGCSELTFYALLEASKFSKYWIPFCKKFAVEPSSPEAYFNLNIDLQDPVFALEWGTIKKLYEDMKTRIVSAVEKGRLSDEIKGQHKGFSEWNSKVTNKDHQSIVQILIEGWNSNAVDIDGNPLPTLIYVSRQKKPQYAHNFKAGALNALIRVSSEISNAPIILNVDCDMYSNDRDAIRNALCFFMDEKQGQQISYVQYPQSYENITNNDLYSNAGLVSFKIELAGFDGYGTMPYIGTGCFHRRDILCGRKYFENCKVEWNVVKDKIKGRTIKELEEASKLVANCSYENGSQWGKEMGLVYGCLAEDMVTGLAIQCRGWKPVYYHPAKRAFRGVAPTTLDQHLVQFSRWTQGMFQIFLSKYCPLIYGHGKIKFGAQLGYCMYLLWAPVSLPTIYYVIIPALCLLHGVPLFPKVFGLWFLPFAYAFVAKTAYSLIEDLISGNTLKGWWNSQRMWVIRRTTAHFFGFIDTVFRQLGLSETGFVVTDKVVDDDVLKRYEQEIMEFGNSSIMFTIISTLALLNLFSLSWGIKILAFGTAFVELENLIPQIIICGLIVMVNIPVYEALFFRRDKGCMPSSVTFKSIVIASVAVLLPIY